MSDEIVPPPDRSDTEPPPPKQKVSDREALVSLALEAICADDEGSLADNILDMLRDMGRDDIIRDAEQLLCEDDDEDAAPTPPVDNTSTSYDYEKRAEQAALYGSDGITGNLPPHLVPTISFGDEEIPKAPTHDFAAKQVVADEKDWDTVLEAIVGSPRRLDS